MSALSGIYGRVALLRRSWYDRHSSARRRLARPVISVGNLAAGGSGKTPVVAALARLLLDMGERPAILSRGYARRTRSEGVVVVSDGDAVLVPVEESGDEPRMLARTLTGVPVLVASDRYLAGTLAETRFGATALLLDDGFQHLQLARTVDLLLVTGQDLEDAVLPSGRLREPLAAARAAHALLVPGSGEEGERISAALGVTPVFTVHPHYEPVQSFSGAPVALGGRRVIAAAGIARPSRFFDALRQQGYDVVRDVSFADHHWFTRRDLERLAQTARDVGADIVVTTEKDAARLESIVDDAPVGLEWCVLPMRVTIEPASGFRSWLRERV